MNYFAHGGATPSTDDSMEMILLALGALAIGLVLGYMLGRNNQSAKPIKAPAKKPAKNKK
jgi:LPXTG-motif cell wall-anchored protein